MLKKVKECQKNQETTNQCERLLEKNVKRM